MNIKNKRGFFGFGIYVILLIVLITGYVVNAGIPVDALKDNLHWEHIDMNVSEAPDLGNALESLVNGIGEASMSFMKWAAQLTYDNPSVPYKLFIILVILAVLMPVIVGLVKILILLIILLVEWRQSYKDKIHLKKLRGKNDNLR